MNSSDSVFSKERVLSQIVCIFLYGKIERMLSTEKREFSTAPRADINKLSTDKSVKTREKSREEHYIWKENAMQEKSKGGKNRVGIIRPF